MEILGILVFIIVVFFLSALIIIPINLSSTYKNNRKKNEELNEYKEFLTDNKMMNCQHISFKNIVRMDIDSKSKQLGIYSYYNNVTVVLYFNEILDFEIFENGNSVVSSRTGSTVAGGLIFGGLGAIAGASGSRTINENVSTLELKIYTNNIDDSVFTLDFLEKSISKASNEYEEIREVINKMISFLKIAREDNRQKERKDNKKVVVENIDNIKSKDSINSLKELAELKEKGIITEAEFKESKRKILNKL